MYTLPFYLGWDSTKLEKLILCCHHEYNHGLFREIKLDFTVEKPQHANLVDDLFGDFCSFSKHLINCENQNVASYIHGIEKLFPDIIKLRDVLTREWTAPYRKAQLQPKICNKITTILNQIFFLLESIDTFNYKRKMIGLDPVDQVDESWKEVLTKYYSKN